MESIHIALHVPSAVITASSVHLVVLPDGRQHSLEVVEVEAGCDLDVGDHPLANPGVDAPGAD